MNAADMQRRADTINDSWNELAPVIDTMPMDVAKVLNATMAEWQDAYYSSTLSEAALNSWNDRLNKSWTLATSTAPVTPVDLPPDHAKPQPTITVLPPLHITGRVPRPSIWPVIAAYILPTIPAIALGI